MTLQELHIKLKELGVPEERYYLHGLYGATNDEEKLSLTIKRGIYAVEYETYYKERGEKHSVITFTSEDEACQYLFKRLKENKEIEDKTYLL